METFLACKAAINKEIKSNINPFNALSESKEYNKGINPNINSSELTRQFSNIPHGHTQSNNDTTSSSQNWLLKRPTEINTFISDVCKSILGESESQCSPKIYPLPEQYTTTNVSTIASPTVQNVLDMPHYTWDRPSSLIGTRVQTTKLMVDVGCQTDPFVINEISELLSFWLPPEILDQSIDICLKDPSFHEMVRHIERYFSNRKSYGMKESF
jgi:hypothetical protein